MQERDDELRDRRNMDIEMDPEIAEILKQSSHVSTVKGNAVDLLRVGIKRRRTKAEIDASKLEQELREEQMKKHEAIV